METQKKREFFLVTENIGFSKWEEMDLALARLLWGDPQVTRYICASGIFRDEEIENRLRTEIENHRRYRVQYWPIFERQTQELIGCCGLRPHGEGMYEMGFHLRPCFWDRGYAQEAAQAVIGHAFSVCRAEALFAGHNPDNLASRKRLLALGFAYVGEEFYEPTGKMHPCYIRKPGK